MVSVVEVVGRFLDWRETHNSTDLKVSIGFLLLLPILFLFSPRRFELALGILLSIVFIGSFNALVMRTTAGLPVIILCGLLAYLLLKWGAKRFM